MNVLSIEIIKNHLNIDIDDCDDDNYLETIGAAAEEAVMNWIDRSYDDLYDEYGECPVSIRQAMLLVCADLYKNRESGLAYNSVPNSTMSLLIKPYKKFV